MMSNETSKYHFYSGMMTIQKTDCKFYYKPKLFKMLSRLLIQQQTAINSVAILQVFTATNFKNPASPTLKRAEDTDFCTTPEEWCHSNSS